jgi:hypothetical protein
MPPREGLARVILNTLSSSDRFRGMKIASRIGGGSFGDIYGGIDTWRNKDVAIKLEQTRARYPLLQYESKEYPLIHQSTLRVVLPCASTLSFLL